MGKIQEPAVRNGSAWCGRRTPRGIEGDVTMLGMSGGAMSSSDLSEIQWLCRRLLSTHVAVLDVPTSVLPWWDHCQQPANADRSICGWPRRDDSERTVVGEDHQEKARFRRMDICTIINQFKIKFILIM